MKKINSILSVLFLLPVFNLRAQVLNVPSVMQQETEWCWSATSDCVLQYFNDTNTQCVIAEYARTMQPATFGSVDCCIDPTDSCNNPNYIYGSPGSIQDILSHFKNISSTGIANYLDTASVRAQMINGTPYFFRWGWNTGGGHFLVGYGLIDSTVYYMDPLNGYQMADYSWVVYNIVHTWTHTLTIDTSITTGISNIPENSNSLKVYPSPANKTISVQLNEANTNASLTLFTLTGQQVIQTYSSQKNTSISVANLSSGIYFLKAITSDGETLTQKVSIIH